MHICPIPTARKPERRWWTCEECGQLWRRVGYQWRMTAKEPN